MSRYVFALQLRRMCYKDGVKLLLFKYQVLENLFRDWGSDITLERRACLAWNRDMIFISRSKLLSSAHYSKSQIFVQKFNFDKTPTFSRVFHPNFFWQFFSWNQSWIFGQKMKISNSVIQSLKRRQEHLHFLWSRALTTSGIRRKPLIWALAICNHDTA